MKPVTVHWFVSVHAAHLRDHSTQVGCCVLTLNQRMEGGQSVTEATALVTCEPCKVSAPYLEAIRKQHEKLAVRML